MRRADDDRPVNLNFHWDDSDNPLFPDGHPLDQRADERDGPPADP